MSEMKNTLGGINSGSYTSEIMIRKLEDIGKYSK